MSGWPPSPFPPAASGPEDVTIRPTEAERDSGPSAATLAAAVGAVLGSGCCALHGCLRPDVTAALLPAARASLAELRAAAAAQPPTADGQRAPVDYAELLERSGGRVDARHRLHEPPFNSPDLVYNRLWYPLVASLLGDECCLLYMGVMWASANAPDGSDQPWHADGGHLYQHEHLPPHCLNVFVPLIDMEQAHGPTEFAAGTHVLGRDGEHVESSAAARFGLCAPAGSAVVFDYRVRHRGAANSSAIDRPVLYLCYCQPWFHDRSNHRSKRRLTAARPWAQRIVSSATAGMLRELGDDGAMAAGGAVAAAPTDMEADAAGADGDGAGERNVLLTLGVQLGEGPESEQCLEVAKGDSAVEVAASFCAKHGLSKEAAVAIAQQIEASLSAMGAQ